MKMFPLAALAWLSLLQPAQALTFVHYDAGPYGSDGYGHQYLDDGDAFGYTIWGASRPDQYPWWSFAEAEIRHDMSFDLHWEFDGNAGSPFPNGYAAYSVLGPGSSSIYLTPVDLHRLTDSTPGNFFQSGTVALSLSAGETLVLAVISPGTDIRTTASFSNAYLPDVPLPASGLLLACVLGGLALGRRRG